MPSSLLTRWKAFFSQEYNDHSKQDYYLAQVSQTVAGMFSKRPTRLKDYLIEFKTGEVSDSKKMWQTITGKKAV